LFDGVGISADAPADPDDADPGDPAARAGA
jgi:hypothetical protein